VRKVWKSDNQEKKVSKDIDEIKTGMYERL